MENANGPFEVYGFKIKTHPSGRRIWPPSFKQFIKAKTESGELTVSDVMNACKVTESLVYKWRAAVSVPDEDASKKIKRKTFSEIVVDTSVAPQRSVNVTDQRICLRARQAEVDLPATYPVDDLVRILHAMNGKP